MKASEISRIVGGTLEGRDVEVTGVAPLERAGPEELSFLAHPRYRVYLPSTRAGAILVSDALAAEAKTSRPRIVVGDVHRALAAVLPRLYPPAEQRSGVHATAVLESGVQLGSDVVIGPYAVIEAGVRLGDRVRVGAHSAIGQGSEIGEGAVLHAHVTVYAGVRVGARTVVHSGTRLGVDGFGYVDADGEHRKIPQVGDCILGEDVEIGANCTVDRGSIGATEIGDGAKIDNLVHIGHNVRIGERSIIVAQVGIAGSTTVGRDATIGGQAGINGHVHIGDGATIAGQAGVFGDVPAGAVYSGYPARPHREALRAQATLLRMPKLLARLRADERRTSTDE